KKDKKPALKAAGLLVLLFITILIDNTMDFPDNPITYTLIVALIIGFVYLLTPSFIIRRWKIILLYFVPILLYFTYIRMFSDGLEVYLELKETNDLIAFLIPFPIFMGICIWLYDQWKWVKTMKADQTKTELSLLKTQISPHFFFNTLNNLYALTVKKSDEAPGVILKLSDMMRYTIYEGRKDLVPLKDEITYLENYIELHKIRYHKSVTIQFEHEIEEGDVVSPLLFIILLENALKHGVESLSQDAFVKMSLKSNAKEVHFTIEDNFDENKEDTERGIGLDNLKNRLSLIYPKRHEFTISEKGNVFLADLKIKKYD
ncbi:MAG: sensor histidine kinase, partial [Flavobacteriales bacterium]|nr:sensor histidine kinase [Flavobacteriales bacterium]